MSHRVRLRDHLKRKEAYHFARTELGMIDGSNLHDHDFTELFWVEKGPAIHWIGGEKRQIDPGTLVFVLPEDFHTVGAADAKNETMICNLAFPSGVWRVLRQRHWRGQADWFCGGSARKREQVVSPAAFDFLRRAGLELSSAPRSGLMLERFFLNLAVALQPPEALYSIRAPRWLTGAVSRVEREGLFRKGPAALTQLSVRSQEHVVRESKRWLKKTPTRLINEMRMRHAATALSTTQQEIIDICYDCGLENVGHFYTLFRQTYGMTPRRYRLTSQAIVKPMRAG